MIPAKKITGLITKLLFIVMVAGAAPMAMAAALSLPNKPLYLGGTADPNIMFTIDDSGSMAWSVMPESLRSSTVENVMPSEWPNWHEGGWTEDDVYETLFDDANNNDVMRLHSSDVNLSYYDPKKRYDPWSNSDGTLWGNASVTCTPHVPTNVARCQDLRSQITTDGNNNGPYTYWPAMYYIWDGVGSQTALGSYTKVEINNASAPFTKYTDRTDCNGANCSYNEELQNYANWFTYYRIRMNVAKAGISKAFSTQGSDLRVGYGAINKGNNNDVDGVGNQTVEIGVRPFTGSDRTAWFDKLYLADADGSTPLRRALDDVGRYFQRTDNPGPWGNDPGVNDATAHAACRPSYNILMTDGFWSTGSSREASTWAARQNVDGNNGPTISTPTSSQYTATDPYQDGRSNTLADVAMYYWYRDLRTDLGNFVPTSTQDTAYWQHMVNFTVGLGVNGTLDPTTTAAAIAAGTDPGWPNPHNNPAERKVDDLWHAAVNSRGQFFSASDPDTFSAALTATLADIAGRTSSAAAVALSSTTLSTGADVYQARFDSGKWSGELLSLPISDGTGVTLPVACHALSRGTICTSSPSWNASTVLTNSLNGSATFYDTGRKIVTYKPSTRTGVTFRYPTGGVVTATSMDTSQITVLRTNPDSGTLENHTAGTNRVNYLRGQDVSGFRSRTNYLGDVVHAAPAFVGAPNSRYPDDWDGATTAPEDSSPYSTFKSTNSSRASRVFAAANDGMLHAFDASNGSEVYAYIPSTTFGTVGTPTALDYGRLNQLTSTVYQHRYFVDETPIALDAFFDDGGGTAAWHTVLTGGLRSGGQGVYALDVTSATAANEAAAAAKILWEFTDADDADLGFTYGKPSIVRMKNGKWAVVVGNGYNNSAADGTASATGNAVLYILFLDADLSNGWTLGTDYIKLDTKVGSTATPNGLASPGVVDVNGDLIADYIYAGDLQGNMWKFDVSDANASNWKTAFGTVTTPVPLFTATDSGGTAQPITTRPQIGNHATQGNSFMVLFGTGKYLEPNDNLVSGQDTQTFYGVWDKNGQSAGATGSSYTAFSRSHLLKQEILSEVAVGTDDFRVSSFNTISWHYASGTPTGSPITTHLGWYLDLFNTEGGNTNNFGEKQVTDSQLRNNKIIFSTLLPSTDPCEFGGSGWLMEVSAIDGARLLYAPFDIDADGDFDTDDYVQAPYDVDGDGDVDADDILPPSGRKSKIGIIGSAAIATDGGGGGGGGDTEFKYMSGSSGLTETVTENQGPAGDGRQSWQQLQ